MAQGPLLAAAQAPYTADTLRIVRFDFSLAISGNHPGYFILSANLKNSIITSAADQNSSISWNLRVAGD
jgi:hypothetical protein